MHFIDKISYIIVSLLGIILLIIGLRGFLKKNNQNINVGRFDNRIVPLILIIFIAVVFIIFNVWLDRSTQKFQNSIQSEFESIQQNNPISLTEDWQIYQNKEYGFELEYPIEFSEHILSTSSVEYFRVGFWYNDCSEECSLIEISIYKNEGKTFEEIKKEEEDKFSLLYSSPVTFQDKIINGENAFITLPYETNLSGVTFVREEYVYSIRRFASWHKINYDEISQNTFDQILSTFKFTEDALLSIENWRAYRNKEYGFELKYPSEYYAKNYTTKNDDYLVMVVFADSKYNNSEMPTPYLGVRVYDDTISINDWLNHYGLGDGWLKKDILTDDQQAIYLTRNDKVSGVSPVVIIQYKNKIFRLENYATNYFDQMLSTFKFTE